MDAGATGRPPGCPATPDLLSDFEEGKGVVVAQGGRNGSWYTFADMVGTAPPTPTPVGGMLPAEALPAGEQTMCNRFALHSTATGHPSYVGVGATFLASGATRSPVDLAAYDGISFRVKAGASSSQAILFEILTKENQPPANGGTASGPADQFNTRSVLLTAIPTTWTTIQVPFGLMGPRNLPSAQCVAGTLCEAPPLNRASVLGLQFSVYDQFPPDSGGYDLWIDEVRLYTGDGGLAPPLAGGMFPFPRDQNVGTCAKPAGASGKFLVDAYLKWKKTFVVTAGSGLRVQRPENNFDSVSEGIAYGMLIAVYMNDKALFDGLFNYWTSNVASGGGSAGPLMTWQIPGGTGSATDADQDAAFALLMAAKQWGGSYQAAAASMIANIWTYDIEPGTFYPKGGSTFTGSGSALTNPSYFSPAYYRIFASVDSGHPWSSVVSAVYTALANIQSKVTGGLVPAWCTSQCTGIGGGNYPDNNMYQYDSHRTPWRIGLDACWNNEPRATSYVTATTNFFAAQSKAAGLGSLADIYGTSGSKGSNIKPNSMSLIGTAAAGAMVIAGSNADARSFLDRSYRFLLDAAYTPDPAAVTGTARTYTYYNATVGLLMALTMSGNFNPL
jgi:endo-1,4-beta-D-glucanase Y